MRTMNPECARAMDQCFSLLAAAEAEVIELRAVPVETREVLRQLAVEVSERSQKRARLAS